MVFDESVEVDKIVGKRFRRGKVQYRIKWVGFTSKDNEWVPLEFMKCDEKIKEFEMSRFEIIGAKMSDAGIVYALKYYYDPSLVGPVVQEMTSAELVQKFPEKIISFLEGQVEFCWPKNKVNNFNPLNIANDFIPACTNQGGHGIKYLWSRGSTEFVRIVLNQYSPEHVVAFLESKLDLADSFGQGQVKKIVSTRGFKKRINQLGVSLFPKVKIERSLSFERYLLIGPPKNGPSNNARTQVRRSVPVQLQRCKDIPIGARGRKRKTFIYFGVKPNPDGRQLNVQTPSVQSSVPRRSDAQTHPVHAEIAGDQDSRNDHQLASPPNAPNPDGQQMNSQSDVSESPVRLPQPAKRTYARASSTPFPTTPARLRPRVLSFSLADESNKEDSSIEVSFDGNMGRLHYDTSDTE